MTDTTNRELLIFAAKAAAVEGEYESWTGQGFKEGIRQVLNGAKCLRPWNPLTDDGDALRLAAKLHIEILLNSPKETPMWVSAVVKNTKTHVVEEYETFEQKIAAFCRVITRAAAAIGGLCND